MSGFLATCHCQVTGGDYLMPWEAYVPKGIDIISISISGNHDVFFILFCLVRSESMFSFLFLVRSWYDSAKSNLFFLFLFLFHFAMTFFLSLRGLHATNVPTCTVKKIKSGYTVPTQPTTIALHDGWCSTSTKLLLPA